ncbi:MAG: rRNA maturation RNase YbeY [Anaerolineae bacterium]|nr:rRNA maturation RNase YbeY [Anaerolineae bacterium]
MIQVLIRPQFEATIAAEWVETIARVVLARENISLEADLSVVITDDDEIHTLNAQFRGIDAPTDVLSFVEEETDVPFVSAPDELSYLGDVIVSYPRAQAQAGELGHGIEDELRLLIVHGVLHLLGYDHATPEEEALMWSQQDQVLAQFKA